jgi:hypothetical protein
VEEAKVLGDAQKRGVISKKQEAAELQRRNILSPEYSYNQDELKIAIENEGLEPEEPIDPRTGEPIGYANSNDIAVANSAA